MTIGLLQAGAKGQAGNSTGKDVADTVNAITNKIGTDDEIIKAETIHLAGLPQTSGAPDGYGDLASAIKGVELVPLGNRFRTPTGASTSGAGSIFGYGRYLHKTPSAPTSRMLLAFAAWFANDTGEQLLGDDYVIEGCGVWVGNQFYRATFDGANSATITNGNTAWAVVEFDKPIPANTTIFIDTADSTVSSGRRRALMGARVVREAGDLVVLGASSYATNLGGVAPTMTLTFSNLQAPSPTFVFCQTNYAGVSSFLVTGDSIAYGSNESDMAATPVPSVGYISRFLSAVSANSVNLGVVGNKPSTAASEAFYQRRFAILDYVKNASGKYPFNFVIDEHIVNDMGGSVTLAALKGFKQAMVSMLKTKFSLPVVSTTPTPRTSAAVSGDYSGDAAQTLGAGNGLNDSRWTYHNDIVGSYVSYGLFGIMDVSSGCQSPTAKDKWITPDGYVGALSAAASAGATSISLVRTGLNAQPKVGDLLVIGAGTATAESITVRTCSIASSSVYTITFVNQSGAFVLINSYASGVTVKPSGTNDGIHPSSEVHRLMAVTMKNEAERIGVI